METTVAAIVEEERSRFPASPVKKFAYGTAGFRDKADLLDRVLFRIGILTALRSKCIGATVGVMITASHNPIEDNGVKVVEPLGEMLVPEWEGLSTELANASAEDLPSMSSSIVQSTGCDLRQPAKVVFARDTSLLPSLPSQHYYMRRKAGSGDWERGYSGLLLHDRPSGPRLVAALVKALEIMEADYTDYGILTTPQLHYVVRCVNTNGAFGLPTEQGYYQKLAAAFHSLVPKSLVSPAHVKLDGANGVGAEKIRSLMQHIQGDVLTVEVCGDGSGTLNDQCGADYVKSQQAAPKKFQYSAGDCCISFDGDADRIVYFYKDTGGRFHLLDGDKIASLAAGFISEKLKALQSDLTIGVVQTAYANGSATAYLLNTLQVPVAFTLTGVKHLHHKAVEYDIGVYFESNGHGTVVFSKRAIETFKTAAEDAKLSHSAREAAKQLCALTELINQAVGDAISDMLMVEIILMHRGWGCVEWDAIYSELPNKQLKVKVRDRMQVQTTDFERSCTSPEGLQVEIDKLVAAQFKGRAFVRPSGTEDVVRVYAEAETQVAADMLAAQVGRKVHELAGGIGDPPPLPTVPQ